MSDTTIELPPDTTLPETPPAAEAASEERTRTPREEAMLRIVERAEAQRNEQLAYGERLTEEARANAAEQDPEEAAQREEEATEAARKSLETAQPAPKPTVPEPAP